MDQNWTRRDVIKAGTALGAASLVSPAFAARAARDGHETIRVGVIGCGGRGTGAAVNSLAADPATKIVAMADLFADRLEGSHTRLMQQSAEHEHYAGRVDVSPEMRFVGFDAYERLLDIAKVDVAILATPPHFRPVHFHAAVTAGAHVFMEKPVAVDPAGVRTVIDGARIAKEKRLSVVAGTQRRHQDTYLELMKRIEGGEIGEVVSARCYWNQGGLWVHERTPEYTDMEWQCRNWLYFCWLSGDHICEQHIHNIDVINWAKGGPPSLARGMGGREVRTEEKYGNIFDHFAIDFEYPDGTPMMSMCRQTDGCAGKVAEHIVGTKGRATSWHGHAQIEGGASDGWRARGRSNPYDDEHVHLIASMRGDSPYLNEARRVAESTLTAIMGRMSAYTGKEVTWEQAMNSTLDLAPSQYAFTSLETDPVPVPGRTPLT
jgi:predicted dehydrogenase